MARLEAADGRWLELTPLGYEFPDSKWDAFDANWLYVEFAAELPELIVSRRSAPCLMTSEILGFVDSARDLLAGTGMVPTLEGLEPCLKLEVKAAAAGTVSVAVAVALEFAPVKREPFDVPFVATVEVNLGTFVRFIDDLTIEMEPFPIRAVES